MTNRQTPLAIEFNDTGIIVMREDVILVESPGYALLDPDEIRFGHAARSVARRHPRRVENQFWDRLSFDDLPHPHAKARTQADLAHGHLRALLDEAKLATEARGATLLVVPGSFDSRQLGLLLGIAQACGLTVEGCLDAGVAAAASIPASKSISGRAVHLDLLLHRAALTHLRFEDQALVRTDIETCANIGAAALQSVFARRIAELFVRRTRFDPLHDAASEQRLHDSLPACLEKLREAESVEVEIEAGSASHRVVVDRTAMAEAARPLFEKVFAQLSAFPFQGPPPAVLLSSTWLGLPGLDESLSLLRDRGDVSEIQYLERASAARGCLNRQDAIRHSTGDDAGRIEWVTRLALDPVGSEAVPGEA